MKAILFALIAMMSTFAFADSLPNYVELSNQYDYPHLMAFAHPATKLSDPRWTQLSNDLITTADGLPIRQLIIQYAPKCSTMAKHQRKDCEFIVVDLFRELSGISSAEACVAGVITDTSCAMSYINGEVTQQNAADFKVRQAAIDKQNADKYSALNSDIQAILKG